MLHGFLAGAAGLVGIVGVGPNKPDGCATRADLLRRVSSSLGVSPDQPNPPDPGLGERHGGGEPDT